MKKKILYLMHVDWRWIKQRPHFLAEELSNTFDVVVVYPRNYRRSNQVENATSITKIPIFLLPFSRFKVIRFINDYLRSLYFWILIFIYRPSIVWFTFPSLIPNMGLRLLKDRLVVYDCMDDAPEFESSAEIKHKILLQERELIGKADIVLATSENLFYKLLARGSSEKNMALVRNAFGGDISAVSAYDGIGVKSNVFRILFIGAVGSHLDMDVMLHCANNIDGVEFHFFGPVAITVPRDNKFVFYGPIEHSDLAERVQEFDCFIMPFIKNELIQGVDPVKLYEYINFNKNIICPYYDEIERFSEFVYFYTSNNSFVDVVKNMMMNNELKYGQNQRMVFLENNSWKVRAGKIAQLIDEHFLVK